MYFNYIFSNPKCLKRLVSLFDLRVKKMLHNLYGACKSRRKLVCYEIYWYLWYLRNIQTFNGSFAVCKGRKNTDTFLGHAMRCDATLLLGLLNESEFNWLKCALHPSVLLSWAVLIPRKPLAKLFEQLANISGKYKQRSCRYKANIYT